MGNIRNILRRLGRENIEPIKPPKFNKEQQEYLIELMSNPDKMSLEQIHKCYKRKARQKRWAAPYKYQIRQFLNQPDIVDKWKHRRYGYAE